ncbi:MAG: DPP IV N-terminal domain-containing protein, partial [Thermoanaerobaculia bacterium]|nr:DPP IV N-terminal domain-containing protein [Thermoanaerobaculia bacterium]
PPEPPAPVRRYAVTPMGDERLQPVTIAAFWHPAVAPDGSEVAYLARGGEGGWYLARRRLDRREGERLAGTSGGSGPFYSPDGRELAFFADGRLKKVSLESGLVTELCTVVFGLGGHWPADDTIVFSPGPRAGLQRVSATGGETTEVSAAEATGANLMGPFVLPGHRAAVVVVGRGPTLETQIAVVGLEGHEPQQPKILAAGTAAAYLSTGQLVFSQPGAIVAAPFDLSNLEITGPTVRVEEGGFPAFDVTGSSPHYGLSPGGTLAYLGTDSGAASVGTAPASLLSFAPDGSSTVLLADTRVSTPRLSPQGDRLAFERGGDIWLRDQASGQERRLTYEPIPEGNPAWSADGERIAYTYQGTTIRWQAADGSDRPAELLNATSGIVQPHTFTPDGLELLLFLDYQIHALSLETGETRTIVAGPARVLRPDLSPDGRWLAYASEETGGSEVFVIPYPPERASGKWRLSSDGGTSPVWAADGLALTFLSGNGLMRVAVSTSGGFTHGTPELLFEADIDSGGQRHFDVAPDGSFVAVVTGEWAAAELELLVAENWLQELEALVPGP